MIDHLSTRRFDVSEKPMMLADQLNLGPKSAAMLAHAGIHTLRDLRTIGAVGAFLAVRACGLRPSMSLLWALHGALTKQKWNELPESEEEQLRTELREAEQDQDVSW